jgi:hypothetical protein
VRRVVWPSAAWPSCAHACSPPCLRARQKDAESSPSVSLPHSLVLIAFVCSAARHGRGELELTSSSPLCSRRSVLPHVPPHAPPPPPSQILARAPLLAAPPPSQFAVTRAASVVGSCARGQGATTRLPAIRDHQQVRVGPLVLPRPSAIAGERPPAGTASLRRPPCFDSRQGLHATI